MDLNIFKSVWASTFKGRYFWVSYLVITFLLVLSIGGISYAQHESAGGKGEWKSLWLNGGWNMLFIFVVGFAQVQLIKNKFGNLVWKNSSEFLKFFSYFFIQILLYSLLYLVTIGIIQQVFALIFYQSPIAYNIEILKAFLGILSTGLITGAFVWLIPSIWTIIVLYLLFQFNGVVVMLIDNFFPKFDWVIALLPSNYVDKLGSIQAWEWYEYVVFFAYLVLSQLVLVYRYNKIWKFN
ncbi:MAG: hypothetical protein K0M56_10090 [Kaistella sp.]|nr:hypothetical protein [Kaistella sp.]